MFTKFESPKFVGEGMSAVSFESMDGKESVLMTFGRLQTARAETIYKCTSCRASFRMRREERKRRLPLPRGRRRRRHLCDVIKKRCTLQSSRSSSDGEERMAELSLSLSLNHAKRPIKSRARRPVSRRRARLFTIETRCLRTRSRGRRIAL